MRQYLLTAREYTRYISIYVEEPNIQQFYFLYRQIAKSGKVSLILRARDLFRLYQTTPFEHFIL